MWLLFRADHSICLQRKSEGEAKGWQGLISGIESRFLGLYNGLQWFYTAVLHPHHVL